MTPPHPLDGEADVDDKADEITVDQVHTFLIQYDSERFIGRKEKLRFIKPEDRQGTVLPFLQRIQAIDDLLIEVHDGEACQGIATASFIGRHFHPHSPLAGERDVELGEPVGHFIKDGGQA